MSESSVPSATPAVSVVMSIFDGGDYVEAAMQSLQQQTLRDIEIIVVNDGSSDGTAATLDRLAATDPRMRVVHADNRGLAASLNAAAALARAPLLARMDGDDISHPDRLQRQLDYLQAHPDTDMLGTAADQIDDNGRVTGEVNVPLDHGAIVWEMMFSNPFVHATVMIRRRAFEAAGGYAPDMRVAQDFDLWSRMVGTCRFANLPDRLLQYRVHATSITGTRVDEQFAGVTRSRRALCERLLGRSVDEHMIRCLPRTRWPRQVASNARIDDYARLLGDVWRAVRDGEPDLALLDRCRPQWLRAVWNPVYAVRLVRRLLWPVL